MISTKVVDHLRSLNEPVPLPMRLPTEVEVSAVETDLGVKFHPDFRQYLLQLSDVVYGTLEPVTIANPESHTHMTDVCEGAWDDYEMPRSLIPVCEDNGDFYCLNKKGEVKFWSSDGATDEKWPNLETWIEQVWIGENEESEDEEDEGEE